MIDPFCEKCQKTTSTSSFNPCISMSGRLNCGCECHDKEKVAAKPSPDFKAHAERFKAEWSKAWNEFLSDSLFAGYTIEDNLANRSLFMAGYEARREKNSE